MARGLVDFADQEAEALRLLGRPDVAGVLAERLEVALVDEFQDTSPIQLALFLRLARIVQRSSGWVMPNSPFTLSGVRIRSSCRPSLRGFLRPPADREHYRHLSFAAGVDRNRQWHLHSRLPTPRHRAGTC